MIEEPIIELLDLLGIDLQFDSFVIKSMPSFLEFISSDQNTFMYELKRREFEFHVSTEESLIKEIAEEDLFSFTQKGKTYEFQVSNKPQDDMTGITRFSANYIGLL